MEKQCLIFALVVTVYHCAFNHLKAQPNSNGKTMSYFCFSCHSLSLCFQPFKSTAKFKWEYNVRYFVYLYNQFMCNHLSLCFISLHYKYMCKWLIPIDILPDYYNNCEDLHRPATTYTCYPDHARCIWLHNNKCIDTVKNVNVAIGCVTNFKVKRYISLSDSLILRLLTVLQK
jgi:hypothetical protein